MQVKYNGFGKYETSESLFLDVFTFYTLLWYQEGKYGNFRIFAWLNVENGISMETLKALGIWTWRKSYFRIYLNLNNESLNEVCSRNVKGSS